MISTPSSGIPFISGKPLSTSVIVYDRMKEVLYNLGKGGIGFYRLPNPGNLPHGAVLYVGIRVANKVFGGILSGVAWTINLFPRVLGYGSIVDWGMAPLQITLMPYIVAGVLGTVILETLFIVRDIALRILGEREGYVNATGWGLRKLSWKTIELSKSVALIVPRVVDSLFSRCIGIRTQRETTNSHTPTWELTVMEMLRSAICEEFFSFSAILIHKELGVLAAAAVGYGVPVAGHLVTACYISFFFARLYYRVDPESVGKRATEERNQKIWCDYLDVMIGWENKKIDGWAPLTQEKVTKGEPENIAVDTRVFRVPVEELIAHGFTLSECQRGKEAVVVLPQEMPLDSLNQRDARFFKRLREANAMVVVPYSIEEESIIKRDDPIKKPREYRAHLNYKHTTTFEVLSNPDDEKRVNSLKDLPFFDAGEVF